MPEARFDNLEDALHFVVIHLVPKRHSYIINVRGPNEIARSSAATVQIVAENMVFKNGDAGLTVHLPFDPASGEFQHLVEFLGTDLELKDYCYEYTYDGIPCFAILAGENVLMAEQVLRFILLHVHGYQNLGGFEYEVYDEGAIGSA